MNVDPTQRAPQVLAKAALVVCALLALANLPSADLPPGWLLAFTAPAALLGRMPRTTRPWRRALLAALLQTAACLAAIEYCPAPTRPAALACTILPPLAFVTARQQDQDRALGLFLSFCVLLVGVILDGCHLPLVAAYGTAACLLLRCFAHLTAHTLARPTRTASAHERSALWLPASALAMSVPCLLLAFAIERGLDLIPSPNFGAEAPRGPDGGNQPRRSVGLDDSFVLDGGGVLSGLAGEQLVGVHTSNGAPVPRDLYLRSGFFAAPGLDRWQLGALDQVAAPAGDHLALRRTRPGPTTTWLEIERYAGARNFVFVPPGSLEIRGASHLFVDPAREWVRQAEGATLDIYEVGYSTPRPPTADDVLDPRARRLGLLTLPAGLDRTRLLALLDEWRVGDQPQQAVTAIANGLAARCRYDRIEPVGPFAHALENFLFADGDRRGYCMHFASAAALLLRLRGIPCRIGVGLYGGDPDRRDPTARIYGSQHAHAWVEIPFADRGYVVFDPTPAAERGARTPSRRDPASAGTNRDGDTGDTGLLDGLLAFVSQPWVLGLALLIAIAAWTWRRDHHPREAFATPAPARTARRLLARLLKTLDEVGHRRRRGETLEAFVRSLAAQQRLLPEVHAAVATYQEIRFGGRPFDGAREQVLLRALQAAAGMAPLVRDGAPTAPQ